MRRVRAQIPMLLIGGLASAQVTACGHQNSECRTDADCGLGQSCVYPVSAGCAAKGQCEEVRTPHCNLSTEYCGCDGSIVFVSCGFSGGSAPVESVYLDSCAHGTKDARGPCSVSADCGLGQGCYYPIADGCSATGTCLENIPGIDPNRCETSTTYCECHSGRQQLVCGGHDGYVAAPVSGIKDSTGACSVFTTPDGGSQK